ncbi:Calicin [Manis javanica]|nr:Calicin [Manis javanica]
MQVIGLFHPMATHSPSQWRPRPLPPGQQCSVDAQPGDAAAFVPDSDVFMCPGGPRGSCTAQKHFCSILKRPRAVLLPASPPGGHTPKEPLDQDVGRLASIPCKQTHGGSCRPPGGTSQALS